MEVEAPMQHCSIVGARGRVSIFFEGLGPWMHGRIPARWHLPRWEIQYRYSAPMYLGTLDSRAGACCAECWRPWNLVPQGLSSVNYGTEGTNGTMEREEGQSRRQRTCPVSARCY